ncbi:MAG: hypothetical protein J5903_03265, partial [Clostridia bacterium]|nr:hypothetical protein [Clostridia bacterium]
MKNVELRNFLKKADENGNLFYKNFLNAVKNGKNTVYHNVVSEAVTLEDSWITTMENALFSVEKIVKNPRKFIIDEDLLVDVERARKTTAKTVRHLSSNSQFVQSITDEGEVRPKKLLTTEMNEDLAIYENRFVCTLVHFCVNFVENKYNEITGTTKSFDQTGAGIISKFDFGTSECELKLDFKVREEPVDKALKQKNEELLEHIEVLRKRLKVLLNTDFIKNLSGKKPVRPPIMKTNLIKMNVDYKRCYKLWLFISSYTFVGFSVAYQDKSLPVQTDFYDDLTNICAMSFQALMQNNCLNKEDYANIPPTPLKEKKYRLLTAYKFEPLFNADKEDVGEN